MAAQSYDRLDGVIWYDGKLVPWDQPIRTCSATVCITRAACSKASAAYGGRIFKSTAHSERLKRSANVVDFESLTPPPDRHRQKLVWRRTKRKPMCARWPGAARK